MSKLTVRLPDGLHHRLRQRSNMLGLSLNQVIVNNLQARLAQKEDGSSEKERAISVLQETGLVRDIGKEWNSLISRAEKVDRDTLCKSLSSKMKGKPLSEIIIEERGRL